LVPPTYNGIARLLGERYIEIRKAVALPLQMLSDFAQPRIDLSAYLISV
jgi:hypothetical protein